MKKYGREILIGLLLFSTVFGQLFRVDLFSNSAGGILVSDVVVLLTTAVLCILLLAKRLSLPKSGYVRWLLLWLVILLLSFIVNLHGYTNSERLVGFGYLLRLVAYSGLLILAGQYLGKAKGTFLRYLAYLTAIFLALGVVILIVLPDFSVLVPLGWDPHVGRLTSTWLDPNYFGTFLALIFTLFLPWAKRMQEKGRGWYYAYLVFLLLVWAGIFFTYSRSALVTFFVGAVLVAAWMSWRTVVIVLLLFSTSFLFSARLQSRLASSFSFTLQQSGLTASSQSASATDPTASARLASWKRAFTIFEHHPVLGAGYNFYQYQQEEIGTATAQQVATNRSAAGSDASLFTLLATTGVIGVLAFLILWGSIIQGLWERRKQPMALGALGAVLAWFVSSFFNNTFLYALILLPMLLYIGIALSKEQA